MQRRRALAPAAPVACALRTDSLQGMGHSWPKYSSLFPVKRVRFVRHWGRQLRRKIYGSDSGYKMWVTRIIDDLGKSREAITLKRGILTEMFYIEGRDFHPLLAEVGKDL